jgi:hypothetical protein
MSDRNQESDRILSVYKISVGFHRISIGIRYGSDRFLSVPIIGLNDLGTIQKLEIQGIQLSDDLRPHPHRHSLCDMELKNLRQAEFY